MLPARHLLHVCCRHAAAAGSLPPSQPTVLRTPITDPTQHSRTDLGHMYTIEPDYCKRLFQVTGLRRPLVNQSRTFGELALLVRRPALDVMDCVRASQLARPARRYLLYGRYGAGKATTVTHLLHWAAAGGWLLLHVPEADRWGLRYKDVVPAADQPRHVDHPTDAAAWLTHFRQQNDATLVSLSLCTRREYTWSRRETTPAGAPLLDLIELGASRIKYASQCVHALVNELKQHATDGRCKLFVAIEKVNAFWADSTVRRDDHSTVNCADLTVVRGFSQLLAADWCGGAVVCTLGPVRGGRHEYTSHLPRHLLGQLGWRALDPFVPVRVDDMTRSETYTMLDYYQERRWLQSPHAATDAGRRELLFRSGGNPAKLAELAALC